MLADTLPDDPECLLACQKRSVGGTRFFYGMFCAGLRGGHFVTSAAIGFSPIPSAAAQSVALIAGWTGFPLSHLVTVASAIPVFATSWQRSICVMVATVALGIVPRNYFPTRIFSLVRSACFCARSARTAAVWSAIFATGWRSLLRVVVSVALVVVGLVMLAYIARTVPTLA